MRFAIEYYGIENVMYGTDYPCWDPATALRLLDEIKLTSADREKLFRSNAKRILGLKEAKTGQGPVATGAGSDHATISIAGH